jgi:diguanylate cyclase (GGDEF)-like protein
VGAPAPVEGKYPRRVVIVTDDNYPPYLFRSPEGDLQGIVRDKWDLWSYTTGVPIAIVGLDWSRAQQSVLDGEADVIEALAQTPARSKTYAFPRSPASVEARIYFHRSISGISDAASLRGFPLAAKAGSACAEWFAGKGVPVTQTYPNSEVLVQAAARGEVRVFCMDSPVAEYYLVKEDLADEFRASPVLYSVPLDWAVAAKNTELREFLQAGFARIDPRDLAAIDTKWRGKPIRTPIATGYLFALLGAATLAFALAMFLGIRNQSLTRMVYGKTSELLSALDSLRDEASRAQHFATRDTLTNLPNRQLFLDRLKRSVARAARTGEPVSVLVVDLDRFRAVNDTFGQDFGDRVLLQAAARLERLAGEEPVMGRIGGDEFALVMHARPEGAEAAAAGVLEALRAPFEDEGQSVYCSASIGIATSLDGTEATELIRNAGIAMQHAKRRGRDNALLFHADMRRAIARRREIEEALRGALERGEFAMHYQARVHLASGQVSGFEALMRWRHPVLGSMPPSEFIPVLESTGLIVPVGEWALRSVCNQIRLWREEGLGEQSVAVNISAHQFLQRDLAARVAAIVAEAGIKPSSLELELTESALIREPEAAARILREIAAHGTRIAIDDFGTGYSSLAYLQSFPIDAIKIDRSFIRDVTSNSGDKAITEAIIGLGHNLGVKVVAEGVETEAQYAFLHARGCDEFQGYLFGPALPAAEIDALLRLDAAQRRRA